MEGDRPGRLAVSGAEIDALELHSDEVRALLGTTPHWIIRSGQGYLLTLVVISLAITWFVHYPDQIDAPVTLTAANPPASVVAKNAGYLVLWAKDNEPVTEGQYLGYLTNTADVRAVVELERILGGVRSASREHPDSAFELPLARVSNLGDLEGPYQAFVKGVADFRVNRERRSQDLEQRALRRQIASYQDLIAQTQATNAILKQEFAVAQARHQMDSVLFSNDKLSPAEYLTQRRTYLAAQREYQSSGAVITSTRITIVQLEDRIRALVQQEEKQARDDLDAVQASLSRLDESVKTWEQAYVLKAPMAGRVALYSYWTDHQYIKAGEEILTVVASNEAFFGKATAPVERSGKIRIGQTVNIKFANYPSEEFGIVNGLVQSISLLPRERAYSVTIGLPNGLVTGYGKHLEFKQEMSGTATIVTEDLRLLERVLYQLRKAVAKS
jgi:hypothetical protein